MGIGVIVGISTGDCVGEDEGLEEGVFEGETVGCDEGEGIGVFDADGIVVVAEGAGDRVGVIVATANDGLASWANASGITGEKFMILIFKINNMISSFLNSLVILFVIYNHFFCYNLFFICFFQFSRNS